MQVEGQEDEAEVCKGICIVPETHNAFKTVQMWCVDHFKKACIRNNEREPPVARHCFNEKQMFQSHVTFL